MRSEQTRRRVAVLSGTAGPAAFVGAWAVGGARTPGYSTVEDAISRIAEVGAPQRPLMTAGFVVFGLAVPTFAVAARRRIGWRSAASLVTAGVATLAVAALPLEDGRDDRAHAVAATTGYVAMAITPLLVRRRTGGDVAIGVAAAASLVATVVGPASGLFQRAGLGVVDAWIVVEAWRAGRQRENVRGAR